MTKKSPVNNATAAEVLRHHFGKEPARVRRLHGGLANHVFEATVARERVIVRISDDPAKLQTFQKEQWAVRKARKAGVPAPEILEVSNHAGPFPYMIAMKVHGTVASVVPRSAEVARQLGRFAAVINSIPTHGFGSVFDWSRNELSRKRTWRDFLDGEMNVRARIELLDREGMLRPESLRRLRKCVAKLRTWSGRPALTHGDLRAKNVLLDDKQKIIAIIDWEDCTSNIAPEWELSIALHDMWIDEKEAFLEGYGLAPKAYTSIAGAVKTLNILNYTPAIEDALQRKDKKYLDALRARLHSAHCLYSL